MDPPGIRKRRDNAKDAKEKALFVPIQGTKSAVAFRGTTQFGRLRRPAFSTCAGVRRCLPAVTCRDPAEPTEARSRGPFGRRLRDVLRAEIRTGLSPSPALFDYHSAVLFPSQSLEICIFCIFLYYILQNQNVNGDTQISANFFAAGRTARLGMRERAKAPRKIDGSFPPRGEGLRFLFPAARRLAGQ